VIHVDRDEAPAACAALAKPDRWGLCELDYALWFFGGVQPAVNPLPAPPKKAPSFKAYKKQAVKDALRALFGNHCAYCESPYAHLMPVDVEHYRPKSGFLNDNGKLDPPGYYWLASDWENLLPSCADCNRERKQYRRGSDNKLVKSKSGKANKFPLAPDSPRAHAPGEHVTETPLLLNPCNDDPDLHLRFLSGGFVEPAANEAEALLPRGRTTIEVCGLDRSDLVGMRHGWAKRVRAAMKAVLDADSNLRNFPGYPDFPEQLQEAEKSLEDLASDDDCEYRALTNTMTKTFDAVRPLIADYKAAESAWVEVPNNDRRTTLVNTISPIDALLNEPGADRPLIADLLKYGHIDLEKWKPPVGDH
jgi:uncharacterized protein (TIGR02646 family)